MASRSSSSSSVPRATSTAGARPATFTRPSRTRTRRPRLGDADLELGPGLAHGAPGRHHLERRSRGSAATGVHVDGSRLERQPLGRLPEQPRLRRQPHRAPVRCAEPAASGARPHPASRAERVADDERRPAGIALDFERARGRVETGHDRARVRRRGRRRPRGAQPDGDRQRRDARQHRGRLQPRAAGTPLPKLGAHRRVEEGARIGRPLGRRAGPRPRRAKQAHGVVPVVVAPACVVHPRLLTARRRAFRTGRERPGAPATAATRRPSARARDGPRSRAP